MNLEKIKQVLADRNSKLMEFSVLKQSVESQLELVNKDAKLLQAIADNEISQVSLKELGEEKKIIALFENFKGTGKDIICLYSDSPQSKDFWIDGQFYTANELLEKEGAQFMNDILMGITNNIKSFSSDERLNTILDVLMDSMGERSQAISEHEAKERLEKEQALKN